MVLEYIYVLSLEDDFYYVGKTKDLAKRFLKHKHGEGARWTALHKPISIIATYESEHDYDEEIKTLEWMDEKGIDKVRGGGYSNVVITEEEVEYIKKKISAMKNRCFICHQTGHYANVCPTRTKNATNNDILEILSFKDLQEKRKMKWLVPYLIPKCGIACMFGKPGCGKTFSILDICLHIVHGKKWNNYNIPKGSVYYVVAEGMYGLLDRINAWHSYHKLSMEDAPFYIIDMHKYSLSSRKFSEQFIQQVKKQSETSKDTPRLIVYDTLAHALAQLNENSSTEVSILLREMIYISNTLQCGTVFIHHSNKSKEEMRGSSALLAAVDTSICIRKEGNQIEMDVVKQKDGLPVAITGTLEQVKESCVITDMVMYRKPNTHKEY